MIFRLSTFAPSGKALQAGDYRQFIQKFNCVKRQERGFQLTLWRPCVQQYVHNFIKFDGKSCNSFNEILRFVQDGRRRFIVIPGKAKDHLSADGQGWIMVSIQSLMTDE